MTGRKNPMTSRQNSVDVLMATYNGARFLDQQIRSIQRQSHRNFRLLVRDDGSSDDTPALLREYRGRRPEQIVLIEHLSERLGPAGSFSALLQQSHADYVMFCDQDDVWLPDRIERTLRRMKQIERRHGPRQPILVHTDLVVADESLLTLGDSFWKYQRLDPSGGGTLNRLLVQNVVTGCACMLNRALVHKAVPIPPEARMHDWWVALVAAAFGRVEHLPEATVIYRQHGSNTLGAKRWGAGHVIRRALGFFTANGLAQSLRSTQRQAGAFLDRFGPELPPQQREAVRAYARIGQFGALQRRLLLLRHGIHKSGWIRDLGLFARI